MLARITQTIRHNAIALLALLLVASGGYALAAGHSTTIHGCVVKSTGELLVKKRCGRGQSKLTFNQTGPRGPQGQTGSTGPAGQAPPSAWANIASNGNPDGSGVSSKLVSTGVFQLTFTPSACAGAENVPVLTSFGGDPSLSGTRPEAWIEPTGTANVFTVYTGTQPVGGGAFTPANLTFDIQDICP
jgi:hypothetical protein